MDVAIRYVPHAPAASGSSSRTSPSGSTSPASGPLDDFRELLDFPQANEALAGCASLEGRRKWLRLSVRTLDEERALPTGAVSVAMPKGDQVPLVLTLQSEPLSTALYGYAIRRTTGKDISSSTSSTPTSPSPTSTRPTTSPFPSSSPPA